MKERDDVRRVEVTFKFSLTIVSWIMWLITAGRYRNQSHAVASAIMTETTRRRHHRLGWRWLVIRDNGEEKSVHFPY